jgi:hypothetical protein
MDTSSDESTQNRARHEAWAKPVDKLQVADVPAEAINLNVEGRQLAGLLNGFGQMWRKTYTVRLSGADVTPTQVIKTWKEHFPDFWPEGSQLYMSPTGIAPGEVGVINLTAPGGMKVSTGIVVIYADDESFSFMTPKGHMFAGMITFSAYKEEGATVAQVQALIRASDPVYEMTLRLGFGHKSEDELWYHTLKSLAAHFGVEGHVQRQAVRVDPQVQWSEAKNIWHNAAIRTVLHTPVRWVRSLTNR